jgi:hypothetical protein
MDTLTGTGLLTEGGWGGGRSQDLVWSMRVDRRVIVPDSLFLCVFPSFGPILSLLCIHECSILNLTNAHRPILTLLQQQLTHLLPYSPSSRASTILHYAGISEQYLFVNWLTINRKTYIGCPTRLATYVICFLLLPSLYRSSSCFPIDQSDNAFRGGGV